MPRFGHAQVIGFSEDVCGVCGKVRAALKAAGVDADMQITRVQAKREKTLALNARQEAEKRQLKLTTAEYEASLQELYIEASGVLDTAMAAVTKNSPDAKNLQRVRSRIRRPVTPAPEVVGPVALVPASK